MPSERSNGSIRSACRACPGPKPKNSSPTAIRTTSQAPTLEAIELGVEAPHKIRGVSCSLPCSSRALLPKIPARMSWNARTEVAMESGRAEGWSRRILCTGQRPGAASSWLRPASRRRAAVYRSAHVSPSGAPAPPSTGVSGGHSAMGSCLPCARPCRQRRSRSVAQRSRYPV